MSDNQQNLPEALFNRLVGSVVSPVVDSVDVSNIVERIDVNDLVGRVDLDTVLARLDLNEILDRVDPDRLLDRIDPDRLLDRVDPDRLLDRLDPDRLLDRVDPDRLLDRVDPDRLLDRVDPDRLLDRLDPDRLLDRVDPDRLLDRLDVNALVQRINLDAMIDAVDVDRVIGRVDLDAAVDRVDLNRALDQVDLNALVERTELGSIIARSTTGVFGELLDVARTQVMAVDQVVQAIPARLLRRADDGVPTTPAGAPSPPEVMPGTALKPRKRAVAFQGRAAGSVSRFLAFVVDQFVIGALYGIGALLLSAAFTVVIGADLTVSDDRLLIVVTYGIWTFVYVAGSLAATGRTIGKAVVGLLVVDTAGLRVSGKAAALRTLVFPISFLAFGIGLLLGLFRRDRREFHDLVAGTAVIYDWDAAIAERRISTT